MIEAREKILRRIDRWQRFFHGETNCFYAIPARYSSGVLKNSREEARTNDSFERHCRDSFQASLEICTFRGKKSVFPPSPVCFRPCFYSSPSRRRRAAVFPPVNKSRFHSPSPLPFSFFSFFLSAKFFFFLFYIFHSSRNLIVATTCRDSTSFVKILNEIDLIDRASTFFFLSLIADTTNRIIEEEDTGCYRLLLQFFCFF